MTEADFILAGNLDSTWKTDLRVSLQAGDLKRDTAVVWVGGGGGSEGARRGAFAAWGWDGTGIVYVVCQKNGF